MRKKNELAVTQHRERCKGCLYCVISCPQSAISVADFVNEKGYNTTEIDRDRCIACGICYTVCPDSVYELEEVTQHAV